MCGRFQFAPKGKVIWVDEFGLPEDSSFPERINLAPTQDAPVIVKSPSGQSLRSMQWGLIPSWTPTAEQPKIFINARAETASIKPSFRDAWQARRCLILTTGYYEWAKKGGPPTLIQRPDEGVFCFAGLWEPNRQDASEGQPSCTVLTTAAAAQLEDLHPRMPVMLPSALHKSWLEAGDLGFPPQGRQDLPFDLTTRLVSRRLNKVAHDDTSCLKQDPQDDLSQPGLFD